MFLILRKLFVNSCHTIICEYVACTLVNTNIHRLCEQNTEKQAKRIGYGRMRADILHDVNVLSLSMSPALAIRANALFFAKWEAIVGPAVVQVIFYYELFFKLSNNFLII